MPAPVSTSFCKSGPSGPGRRFIEESGGLGKLKVLLAALSLTLLLLNTTTLRKFEVELEVVGVWIVQSRDEREKRNGKPI